MLSYIESFVDGWATGATLTIGTGMLVTGIKAKGLDKKSRAYLIFTGGALVYKSGKEYVSNLKELVSGVKELIDEKKEEEYEEMTA